VTEPVFHSCWKIDGLSQAREPVGGSIQPTGSAKRTGDPGTPCSHTRSHTAPRCQKIVGKEDFGTHRERAGRLTLRDPIASLNTTQTLDTLPDAPDDPTVTPGSQLALPEEERVRKCSLGRELRWFAEPGAPHFFLGCGRRHAQNASGPRRSTAGYRHLGRSSIPGRPGHQHGPPPSRSPGTWSPMP
jgi:hypothetical protein